MSGPTNLDYLFTVDRTFHDAVVVLAAAAIGTTNPAFAAEWLGMEVDDGRVQVRLPQVHEHGARRAV